MFGLYLGRLLEQMRLLKMALNGQRILMLKMMIINIRYLQKITYLLPRPAQQCKVEISSYVDYKSLLVFAYHLISTRVARLVQCISLSTGNTTS